MLDEYFKRKDVLDFIEELQGNPKYLKKIVHGESKYGMQIKDELALYLFYDIILKYKIIVDDEYLFPDFLMQIEKLFIKIDNYDDMMTGVYRLLISLVATILDVRDIKSEEGRRQIVLHFYQKYVVDGYFIHGYSTTYEEFIKGRSFIPEKYPNHYSKMLRIRQIFAKYKIHVMDKDFQKDEVYFTDDFIMGCHYSASSPGYFYQLLQRSGRDNGSYLKQDFHSSISSLKRFMNNNSFSSSDQKTVLRIVEEEWNFIHRVPKKISLLFIKRKSIMNTTSQKILDYLDSDKNLIEIVERILTPKYNNVILDKAIRYGEYQLVNLENFYKPKEKDEKVSIVKNRFQFIPSELSNSYGVASILLIMGSFFITLGVIVSIIMILRGM